MRIPVTTVVGMVAERMSGKEIVHAYPDLEPEDLRAALLYAAPAATARELPSLAVA